MSFIDFGNPFLQLALKIIVVLLVPLGTLPLIIHVERRGAGFIQNRVGPNRVGPFGLLQPLADVVKFMFKEEALPSHVRPFFYFISPALALLLALLPLAGIPFFGPIQINGVQVFPEIFRTELGILYVFAATTLGPHAILLAGWASNNKYTVLGSIRACAQMMSYELSMSSVVVTMLLVYNSQDFHTMSLFQNSTWFGIIPKWGIFMQPIAATLFLVGIFAESNRLPFDLAEGESELVAGYHLEYSSMKFAMFFMAEYIHVIGLSMVFIFLFLGGYHVPWVDLSSIANFIPLIQIGSLLGKTALMVWLFIWVRWSLPRFRYDHLMKLGWNIMLPLSLVNFIITVFYLYLM
ncbi:MAG: complex I subunit 1 family protein [Bacteriovoracaceae bacterium]